MKKPLPIGVDSFEDLIRNGYYYVDKTLLVKQVLELKGEGNLFTRPRRFGKTLNLSMLRYFFEDTLDENKKAANRKLFDGLQILGEEKICEEWMGTRPVISLTLKSAKQPDFDGAFDKLKKEISEEYRRHSYVENSTCLTDKERERFHNITEENADYNDYADSLKFLSTCLNKVMGQKVIILIDEYDVPLENSYFRGFYREMTDFIRSLFESALKTNDALEFAVITGCLRISKESIFTGLNHLNVNTIMSENYAECFGFTPEEVENMVSYYERSERMEDIRKWYDGYRFGGSDIYNPWSVIKFAYELWANADAIPEAYWINTSANDIIKNLVAKADSEDKKQIECLIEGGSLEVAVHEEVTYEDMNSRGAELWNFLYFTGYLTKEEEWQDAESLNRMVRLVVPNVEVRKVFERTVLSWFKQELKKQDFQDLYAAMEEGNALKMQAIINEQLQRSISFYDSAEIFYHGFMIGLLSQSQRYLVKSNRESGNGRYDVIVYPLDLEKKAYVFEFKASEKFRNAMQDAETAVEQIREKEYGAELEDMGYEEIDVYGIAFYRKNCKVSYGGAYKTEWLEQ